MARQKRKQVEYDGILFDSKTELDFYLYLQAHKRMLRIQNIELQKTYELIQPFDVPCFICRGTGRVRGAKEGTQKNCTKCSGKGLRRRRGMSYTPDFIITYTDGSKDVIDVKGQGNGYANASFSYYKKVFEYTHLLPLIKVYWSPVKKMWIWE